MRRKILPFILGGALAVASVAPAAAQTECPVTINDAGRGGAAALVALVQANVDANVGAGICDVTINVANNSLNNLLRNADVNVLRNILNNSPILSNNNIEILEGGIQIDDTLNQVTVNVAGGPVLVFR